MTPSFLETTDYADAEAILDRQNSANASRFEQLAKLLTNLDIDIEPWVNHCRQLAESGWNAGDLVSAYLEFTEAVIHQSDFSVSRLVEVGSAATALCRSSAAPASVYLLGLTDALQNGYSGKLKTIELIGLQISDRYHHATNLITEFYTTGFELAVLLDFTQLESWSNLCANLIESGRTELMALFETSRLYPRVNWVLISSASQISLDYGLKLAAFLGEWQSRLQGVENEFAGLVKQLARQGDNFLSWLDVLSNLVPKLTIVELHCLMHLMKQANSPKIAYLLCETAQKLPLQNKPVLDQWLFSGLEFADSPENVDDTHKAIIEAFFRLESATSVDLLEALLGQVRLSDEQKHFQLLVEAWLGNGSRARALKIEPSVNQSRLGNHLCGTDGKCIYLPELAAPFPDRDDNLQWFRLALIHQLAGYEYGTYAFQHSDKNGISAKPFETFFNEFAEPGLARQIFRILEAGRLDWRLAVDYPGLSEPLEQLKNHAAYQPEARYESKRLQLLAALELFTLDVTDMMLENAELKGLAGRLKRHIEGIKQTTASVFISQVITKQCYELIVTTPIDDINKFESAAYRGLILFDETLFNIGLASVDDPDLQLDDKEQGLAMSGMTDANDVTVDDIQQGDVSDGQSISLPEDAEIDILDGDPKELSQMDKLGQKINPKPETRPVEKVYQYDEWDHTIGDYRRRWCTLYEVRQVEEDLDYVTDTLNDYRDLANEVRRQLNNLRPERLRKVKGVEDGEELDIERAIEALVDKRAGLSPDEKLYIERQRKERDVSTLFLLDMSASTDDLVPDTNSDVTPPVEVDYENYFFEVAQVPSSPKSGRRIIDLEKQAAILMADALQNLGDNYAICGFSGYGRDKVEYFVCKDFQDDYNHRSKGRIGGIKPCRSTRMGPAIRHATQMLISTESKIKALIIISDGYPQDFDYGSDRNSRVYGIKDTTKALSEAQQNGIQSFCLTVDQSGHDYLREMCPDQQYMVIKDLEHLPRELSKIYRGLTT